MSYSLLNKPEDIVEGLISTIFFIILYLLYRYLTESDETINSIKSLSIIQYIIMLVVMTLLYFTWYYGTKIITNYIYINKISEKI